MNDGTRQAAVSLVEGRTLRCLGTWTLLGVAQAERVLKTMAWPRNGSLPFDTSGAVVLYRALTEARQQGCEVTEIDVFLQLSCFFNDPADVSNLISGSSAFSKTNLNIRKFTVHILLKPGLENFEHYFTSMGDECNCAVV